MVFDFLKRGAEVALPEKKASATGRVVAWGSSGRVAWSARDLVSLGKTGFQGNPMGFRAVKLISEAAAALPLILQDNDRRYDQHPVLDLIRRPNGAQGRAELFEAVYGHLLLSGNAYLEAVPGEGALPAELHVLRADRMAVVDVEAIHEVRQDLRRPRKGGAVFHGRVADQRPSLACTSSRSIRLNDMPSRGSAAGFGGADS